MLILNIVPKFDTLMGVVDVILDNSYIATLCNNNHERSILLTGVRYFIPRVALAAIRLEGSIPTLVKNAVDNTLTANMMETIELLSKQSYHTYDLVNAATNENIDNSLVPEVYKVEAIVEKAYVAISRSELSSLSLTHHHSKVIDALWLYTNLCDFIHQADYDRVQADLSIH